MGQILNILATPDEVFEKIKDQRRWFLPALLFSAMIFVLLWLGGCWRNIVDGISWTYILGPALISPLIVGIVSVGTTAILYLLCIVLAGRSAVVPGFKTMFSLNIHCAAIILLSEIINFLLVHAEILGETNFPLPNRFPMGLDLVLLGINEPSIYITIALHCTSIFVIWYLVVLAKGIGVITGSSRTRSGLIAAGLWCAIVLSTLGLVYAAGGDTTFRIKI